MRDDRHADMVNRVFAALMRLVILAVIPRAGSRLCLAVLWRHPEKHFNAGLIVRRAPTLRLAASLAPVRVGLQSDRQ